MTALALLCVALIGFDAYLLRCLTVQRKASDDQRSYLERAHMRERELWNSERSELLTRIQHPKLVVGLKGSDEEPRGRLSPLESDQSHLIGTVQAFDGNGDSD